MSFMLVAGSVAFGVFLLSYIRSGRFGSTVLAFGAGYLLALLWTDTLAQYKAVQLPFLSWHDAVYVGLIVVPGLLALFFSHKQKSLLPRLIAALAVALLAVALLLPVFAAEPQSATIYTAIIYYREVIISVLLALGLLDMVFSRLPKPSRHHTKD